MRTPLSVGLPRWHSEWKECTCQCRTCKTLGCDPWVGKIPWRRKWQPTPVFLPEKFHGQRCLVGYSSRSLKELHMTERPSTHTHTHTHTPLSGLYSVHSWHPGPQSLPFAYVNQSKSRAYYNEVSPHTGQTGHQSKGLQTMNAGEGEEKKENPPTLLVGM